MNKEELKLRLLSFLYSCKGATGSKQVIGWIITILLAGVLGGGFVYAMWQFESSASDANVTQFIIAMDAVFDLIPTWTQIIMIMGFVGVIALIGLVLYKQFESRSKGM